MTLFNQTQRQTKWMQRMGLVGLTASAALTATALAAIANPPALGNSRPSGVQPTETPVAPAAQAPASQAPSAQAPGAQAPGSSAPMPTAPRMPTAPTPTAPSMTAPASPTAPMQMQMPTSPTSPTNPVTRPAPGATVPGASVTPTAPAKPTVQTPAAPAAPRTSAATGTIADVAAASSTFKTLVSALNEAELTEVLKGQGPFTVFAPTDAAFSALPTGTLDELMKPENRATLVQLLKYHVVSGAYPSSRLTAGPVPSVQGSPITVSITDGKVMVNNANVIQSDITATNGVIHAIDRVILPPSR